MPVVSQIVRRVRAFLSEEVASITPTMALLSIPLLGAVGGTLDYARLVETRADLQAALDNAVLAGAKEASATRDATAARVFASNAAGSLTTSTPVPTFGTPSSGTYSGTLNAIIPANFLQVFGLRGFTVSLRSTATVPPRGEPGNMASQVCLLLLSTEAGPSLVVNGGAQVSGPNCEVHVRSANSPAAILNSGAQLDVKRFCVKGSNVLQNGAVSTNPETRCAAIDDPYAGKLPGPAASACDYSNTIFTGGHVTLKPGVYCGWFTFNARPAVTFEPGLYVIKTGGWVVNGGQWSGTGVTFYFADSSRIQFNGAMESTLSAPAGGPYANVLMFEAPGLARSGFTFDVSRGQAFTGLIYLPSRDVTWTSTSKVSSEQIMMVFNSLILDKTRWTIGSSEPSPPNGTNRTNSSVALTR